MTSTVYFHHASSLEHDTGPHPESAHRIPAIEAELLTNEGLELDMREAPQAGFAQLAAVHARSHIEEIRALSGRGGGALDPDTVMSAGSFNAACHAAGGACAMAEALAAGEAASGFCALRPPGHHAERDAGMGFCLFNNVAIAAQYALDHLGVRRVLILDWDVHHGNGTNDIFHTSAEVLYSSIHQSPLFPGTGPLDDVGTGDGEGYTINLPVPAGSDEKAWLALVQHVIIPAAQAFEPQLILISAGFDAHASDPLASCRLTTDSYAQMARKVRTLASELSAPVGCVLEGGYSLHALAESVNVTLEALSDDSVGADFEPSELTEAAIHKLGRYWPFGSSGAG
jgi:acetoin utilization deacetylase AcuC-like enzyme